MHTGIDTAVFFDWKNLYRRFIRSLGPIQGLLTEIKPAEMANSEQNSSNHQIF